MLTTSPTSPETGTELRPAQARRDAGSRRAWQVAAVSLLVATVATFVVPADGLAPALVKVVAGWLASLTIVVVARRRRVPAANAWYFFAAGVWFNSTGVLTEWAQAHLFESYSTPSWGDPFWLTLYPALFFGMGLLFRHRHRVRNWPSAVDAATLSVSLGLLAWVYLIHPAASTDYGSNPAQAIAIAYPVGDLIVLTMLIRLLMAGGRRVTSFNLMTASMALFLVQDIGWAILFHVDEDPSVIISRLLNLVATVAYMTFAIAALHPSVEEVGREQPDRSPKLTRTQLTLLTAASLTAPSVLILEAVEGQVRDAIAIGIGSTALFLLVVARMVQLIRQVEAQAQMLNELAQVDMLTGLANRRALDTELSIAIERSKREGTRLTIALLDLDNFKQFNDQFGHPAGDELLREAASAWRQQIRNIDFIARYGGEEFILIFSGAPLEAVGDVFTRLRQVTPFGQTFSAGVAMWNGADSSDELIARADRALYRAKHEGRDRVCVAERILAA